MKSSSGPSLASPPSPRTLWPKKPTPSRCPRMCLWNSSVLSAAACRRGPGRLSTPFVRRRHFHRRLRGRGRRAQRRHGGCSEWVLHHHCRRSQSPTPGTGQGPRRHPRCERKRVQSVEAIHAITGGGVQYPWKPSGTPWRCVRPSIPSRSPASPA